jgi:hypothetical protein
MMKLGYGGHGALLAVHAANGADAGFGGLNTNNRSSNSNANIWFRFYRYGFPCKEIKRKSGCRNHASQGLLALLVAGKKT